MFRPVGLTLRATPALRAYPPYQGGECRLILRWATAPSARGYDLSPLCGSSALKMPRLLEHFGPRERHDDVTSAAGKNDFPMHRIESEPGELHSRQLLYRDSRARRVFLVVQIPRTDGSP